MYNRYVPQQDGTFLRNQVPSPHPPQPRSPMPQPRNQPPQPSPPSPPSPPPQHDNPQPTPYRHPQGAGAFLRQLLPKNLDTADLLIIVLLLLMAGDSEENQSNWLLTLALYLFL